MKRAESSHTDVERELLTTKELARALKVTERTVQNLVSRGTVQPIKIGRCVRFVLGDVLENLKSQK
ncbi:MAG: helix-turn-helix domain-containing protein [Verrucomicrobiales bacterium]|nr:helix-turn-helix domain-containing protein [Verrucomicrobiales bacterium]